jgi:hypothetical protein
VNGLAEENPKRKEAKDEAKPEAKVPEHPIGEELDIIHSWCPSGVMHMTNVAYNEQGASMFQCPGCGLKVVVAKVD